jgi:hypothetical protein
MSIFHRLTSFSFVLLVPNCCRVRVLLLRLLLTHNWTRTVIAFIPPHLELSSFGTDSKSSQSQSHIVTDGQSASKSWCQAPLLLFDSYSFVFVGRPLWWENGCLLYMLLALVSAVFLGSESLGTRDHIIVSHIWGFPFRRLLQLAKSW